MYGSVWYNRKKSLINYSHYDFETGKREFKSEKWVPDFYTITQDKSALKSQDGKNLERKQERTWSKRRNKIKSLKEFDERVFGSDLSPENKFILETWPNDIEQTVPKINYIFIDIECESENGFPNAETVPERVNLITVYSNEKEKFFTLGLEQDYTPKRKDVSYVKCSDEYDLLRKFCKLMMALRPDIISGWNSKGKEGGYDIPYLFNRILMLLDGIDIQQYNELLRDRRFCKDPTRKELLNAKITDIESRFEFINKLSPYGSVEKRTGMEKDRFNKQMKITMEYIINGVTDYDYLQLYQQFELGQKESYKLDDVANEELGEKKLDLGFSFKEAYKPENWETFVDYNIQDVALLVKLEKKKGYLHQAICLSYKCHCIFKDNFGTVTKQECAAYNFLFNKGIIMEDNDKKAQDEGTFEGAYVKEPVPDMYEWVIDVDIASLYPSLMRGINISPDVKKFEILNCPDRLFRLAENEPNRELAIKWKDGRMEEISAEDLVLFIKKNNWFISSANVVFENKDVKKGIIPEILDTWYAQRKADKKLEAEYKKKAQAVVEAGKDEEFSNCVNVDAVINDIPTVKYLTVEEHEEYLEFKRLSGIHFNKQWSCKILLNSLYGAVSTPYFRFYDHSLSKSVTLSGQTVIKNNGVMLNEYFKKEVFDNPVIKKKFTVRDDVEVGDTLVYTDTDSVASDSIVRTNEGSMKIETLFDVYMKQKHYSQHGHEIIDTSKDDLKCMTFNEQTKKAEFGKVNKLIRHKVMKKKWTIKAGGREVQVTNDHSCMVMRDGEIIEVKPCDIRKTDKLVVLK